MNVNTWRYDLTYSSSSSASELRFSDRPPPTTRALSTIPPSTTTDSWPTLVLDFPPGVQRSPRARDKPQDPHDADVWHDQVGRAGRQELRPCCRRPWLHDHQPSKQGEHEEGDTGSERCAGRLPGRLLWRGTSCLGGVLLLLSSQVAFKLLQPRRLTSFRFSIA